MKKFDISNVIISRICDIYSYTLPEDTEGDALTAHSVLIIKRKGSSDYTVNGKKEVTRNVTASFGNLDISAGLEASVNYKLLKKGDTAGLEIININQQVMLIKLVY